MSKRKQLQDDIDQMEEVYEESSTPQDVKNTLQDAIKSAKQELNDLKEEPEPVKKKLVAKTDRSKIKPRTATLEDCKDIIAKYTKTKKTANKRVAKRISQGKPADLTVPETLKKTAKSVNSKVSNVVEADAKISKQQQIAAGNQIIEIVKEILKGLGTKKEKQNFVNSISSAILKIAGLSRKAEDGIILENDLKPESEENLTASGNLRIGYYRTENFNTSPEAQKIFDELEKEVNGVGEGTTLSNLLVQAAKEMDKLLEILNQVQAADKASRQQFMEATGKAMLLMFWFGKLFDHLSPDFDINKYFPRFIPAFLYSIAIMLPNDDSPEMAAFGKRLKSAINRDRAYESNEVWELNYSRKGNTKHPHYAEDGTLTSENEAHLENIVGVKLYHAITYLANELEEILTEAKITKVNQKAQNRARGVLNEMEMSTIHSLVDYLSVTNKNEDINELTNVSMQAINNLQRLAIENDETSGRIKILIKEFYQKVSNAFNAGGVKMKEGGHLVKNNMAFKQKQAAIAKNLAGKVVPKKLKRKYGKKYSKDEAGEAAANIAGYLQKKGKNNTKKALFGGIINVRTPDNLFNAHSGDGSIDF